MAGYATPEQQRLIEPAEHWRDRLIRDGTTLEPEKSWPPPTGQMGDCG
jgi:hypothetical protein